MAKATYIQPGETIDYVNTGDEIIETMTVVALGERIGVTGADILPGATGVVHTVGVFELAKEAEALDVGDNVFINADGNITATDDDDNTPAGWVISAAASGDATVRVKIG